MTPPEAVAILVDLKNQFERLDDLVNMDWMIFTYDHEPPWFYVTASDMSELTWFNRGRDLDALQTQRIAERHVKVKELKARLVDTLAALDLASTTLAAQVERLST